jgi:predicted transcriptional regulator
METSNNEKYTIDVTTPGMDTMYVDTDAPNVISVVDYIDTDDSGYNIDWNNITITGDEPSDLTVSGDIIQETPDGSINITEIIHEQKLQIQVLTDMIQEMVEQSDFNLQWNVQERIEKQRFLNRLGEK